MTVEEKRKALEKHCNSFGCSCEGCALENIPNARLGGCHAEASDEVIEKNYEMIFGPDKAPVNTCISCGAEIPEGSLVCSICEEQTCETCAFTNNSSHEKPCVDCKNNLAPSDPRYVSTPCNWKPEGYIEPDPIENERPTNMQVMSYEEHKENTLGNIRESVGLDPIKPEYYNDTKITPFDVIDDWDLNFYLGNAVKYIKRAGKKEGNSRLQDLKKIREYIDHEIRAEE